MDIKKSLNPPRRKRPTKQEKEIHDLKIIVTIVGLFLCFILVVATIVSLNFYVGMIAVLFLTVIFVALYNPKKLKIPNFKLPKENNP